MREKSATTSAVRNCTTRKLLSRWIHSVPDRERDRIRQALSVIEKGCRPLRGLYQINLRLVSRGSLALTPGFMPPAASRTAECIAIPRALTQFLTDARTRLKNSLALRSRCQRQTTTRSWSGSIQIVFEPAPIAAKLLRGASGHCLPWVLSHQRKP